MRGNLWTIAIIIVFLAMMLPAVSIGFEGAENREDIENEPLTLIYQEPVPVEYADYATNDTGDVTIVDSEGEELTVGEDYEWDSGNVTALQSNLDDETVLVNYTIEIRTDETTAVGQVLGVFDGWIAIVLLFAAIGSIVAMVFPAMGSNFGGR